ncbi:esterase/lipase family protein [Kitasatospora sp. NPDC094019]|uniref:esterase/lipase family protein n=1 Tax=Kitasatospora sp. NPDC094019 TaxID=3364091 RepID=UPI00382219B2
MSAPSSRLPIVYVRGYAGGTPGIEKAVTDPFYGFNEGSTHIRVGRQDSPVFYQFESPLLRLLTDEGYHVLVEGGQDAYLANHPDKVDCESVWIHRFYDRCSGTWGGEPQAFSLERAAEDLLRLIEELQARGAPQVHLVAHSMGGLICRCLLQKVIPEQRKGKRATDYVSKLFTYGTPHGGITFAVGFGIPEALRDTFDFNGADVFGPDRMYRYLTPDPDPDGPPEGWRAVDVPHDDGSGTAEDAAGGFPLDRIFCMIGTDSDDYDVAHGASASAVGPRSDGLVQIENAQVTGANRAFTHRSHSGRYGLVNSEEGYQNLRRFLFGDLRVRADLVDLELSDHDPDVTWQAEVRLQVRGLPVLLHERTAPHWCPIQLSDPTPATLRTRTARDGAVQLATTFLSSRLLPHRSDAERATADAEHGGPPGTSEPVRFALDLRVLGLKEHNGFFGFGDHLEQTADFADTLIVDVDTDSPRPAAWAHWNSEVDGPIRDLRPTGPPLPDEDPRADAWLAHIPLPATTGPILGPDARIRLTVGPWS